MAKPTLTFSLPSDVVLSNTSSNALNIPGHGVGVPNVPSIATTTTTSVAGSSMTISFSSPVSSSSSSGASSSSDAASSSASASSGASSSSASSNSAAVPTGSISYAPADPVIHSTDGSLALNHEGYLVVQGALTSEQAALLAREVREDIFRLVFTRRDCPVDPHAPASLTLLTDAKKRAALGDRGKDTVQVNGNPRKPRISKSTGMIHTHFNPIKMTTVDYNPRLYELASQVYGTSHLAFRTGAERVSLKAQGATDMPKHIDKNPFHPEVNYDRRIQSLVCLSIDTEISPRDSGTTNLFVNFHHYWNFAAALFHPTTGLMKAPENRKRFYALPPRWATQYEPFLLKHIADYTAFVHTGIEPSDPIVTQHYRAYQSNGITVPAIVKLPYWKPIPMRPGDVLFWSQDLPHQSLRNKSPIPRTVAYYNAFPITPAWYGSAEHKWVVHQFTTCQFHYLDTTTSIAGTGVRRPESDSQAVVGLRSATQDRGHDVNKGVYSYDIVNKEEYEELVETGQVASRVALTTATPLAAQLTGQARYPDLT